MLWRDMIILVQRIIIRTLGCDHTNINAPYDVIRTVECDQISSNALYHYTYSQFNYTWLKEKNKRKKTRIIKGRK